MGRASFLDRLERAYLEKLRELEVDAEESGVDPVEVGERLALMVATRAKWEGQLGLLLSSTDFQRTTGLTRQALSQAVGSGRVLRLLTADDKTRYPAFQLDGRRLLPGLRPVLRAFAQAGVSGWTAASWLTTRQPELGDEAPAEWLRRGGDPEVVAALALRRATRLAR